MSVFRDEIFGPVLALSTFDSLEEALRLANDSCYVLSSASSSTKDLETAQKYIAEIEGGADPM